MSLFLTPQEFIQAKEHYQLGFLTTEKPNSLTTGLSQVCKADISKALEILKNVDTIALKNSLKFLPSLEPLSRNIQSVLNKNGRIFIVGCGATGRLALSLEYLWRRKYAQSNTVTAFMAGGDIALVSSLEGFEDRPDYGEKHLTQLGFTEKDILIAVTEGGETPYVIGAALAGASLSNYPAFFLYTNPREEIQRIERSRRVINHKNVIDISIPVGSMALAGSTRMQSSTVLMMLLGHCMGLTSLQDLNEYVEKMLKIQLETDYQKLTVFTEFEAHQLANNRRTLYSVNDLVLPVFTDTTERAPTFSMVPMSTWESMLQKESSRIQVMVRGTKNSTDAWGKMLLRTPHSLQWQEERTQSSYIYQCDFSESFGERWKKQFDASQINLDGENQAFLISGDSLNVKFNLNCSDDLSMHLMVKMLLNAHSTVMMGREGRFESNIMTWVKPSNGKLIDRAARYVMYLMHQNGYEEFTYETIINKIYEIKSIIAKDESIVMKCFESLAQQNQRELLRILHCQCFANNRYSDRPRVNQFFFDFFCQFLT
ncbi:MAG: hypothetical protein R2827_05670 [Bdellovibrionales bacterium]